jgi:hypothetical protein
MVNSKYFSLSVFQYVSRRKGRDSVKLTNRKLKNFQ